MPHDRLPYTDPLRAGRHPFQTYLLMLCVVAGIPLATGQTTPGSIEDTLPLPLVIAWGGMLVLGATVALIGTYLPQYATALTMERAGLWSTGGAAVAYGLCIFATHPLQGMVAACIIVAFGAACIRRARDIGHIFHRALSDNNPTVDTEPGR